MSASTLHRIEHGRREVTLSEVAALAGALQINPWKLIRFRTADRGVPLNRSC